MMTRYNKKPFFFLTLFILRGGEGGRKRWRETSIGRLLFVPWQACAPTENRTGDLSVCGTTEAKPTEPYWSGPKLLS